MNNIPQFGCYVLSLFTLTVTLLTTDGDDGVCVSRKSCIKSSTFRDEIAKNLSAAIVEILESNYVEGKHKRVFNFYAYVSHAERMHFFKDIMEYTLHSTGITIGVRLGAQQHLPGDVERHYSILLVDNVVSLSNLCGELIKYHLHIDGYFVIVLYNFQRHYYEELFRIIDLNWYLGIINVNILVYSLQNLILLYGIEPYNNFHCKGLSPAIQNKFIDSHWQQQDFFPDRLSDLYGCPLICATWEELPYFVVSRAERQTEMIGIEGKLLEYISVKLNFSVVWHWMDDEEIEATLDDEGAVFDKLFSSGIDFSLGAFHYKPTSVNDSYAPTTAYYLSNYHFIVNSMPEQYAVFVKLLLPFLHEVWALIFLLFICGIILSLVLRCHNRATRNFIMGSRNDTPVYNMFVVILGGSIAAPPTRNFARFLIFLWIIAAMVLRCAYQAYMYHYIKSNISIPLPVTIDGIVGDSYEILMTDVVLKAVQHLPRIHLRAHLLNGSEMQNFDMIQQRTDKVAILSAFEYFGYYQRLHPIASDNFHIVRERIFTQQLSIYMRKNSIMLSRFNQIIWEYISVGLMDKWEQALLDTTLRGGSDSRSGRNTGNAVTEEPKVLRVDQLNVATSILIIGATLSSAVFIMEFLIYHIIAGMRKSQHHRKRKQRSRSKRK